MEGDDDELEDSDCSFHDCWKTDKVEVHVRGLVPRLLPSCLLHFYTACDKKLGRSLGTRLHVRTSYFAHVLTRRCVYSRVVFISLNCAAFIRGWHLFEGGVYSRKYGNHRSRQIVHPACTIASSNPCF